ncbi:Flp pilus assembly protein CpaB [Actimicrobium sp. CCI2.3]|uniref:Flp pilus assembly protein CpaB n=1 Tax=Actimicrobium sp. CCI2.3 TaxID=3048616 RepID=UPI002AB41BF6|nr:Flp pilus assembly protein CpaB [Actimicrobium sp. CCI2.3]MDY7575537.1 Flp pilus assembly protein CpaB [Actimicrobium sp. CCI2.3]MEB0022800.1 Flp pilus assembly protein CpaB [Actimicrobium sp. CCI2.3]
MKFPSFGNARPEKTWLVLGVALTIGVGAALLARSFLSDQIASIEARGKGPTVPVVVAKGDLSKGTVLSADNVAVRQVPREFAHSASVLPEQFPRIDGQPIAYGLKSGESVMWGLMEGKKVPTFSARVDAGHRAMTVPVDEINSISGLLEPGDSIDLIVSVDHGGKKITFPLLQAVQVMATGQRAVDDPRTGERRQFSTVTLDTTPEQAQNVIVAREAGKLTALLRNPADHAPMAGTRGDLAALLGLQPERFRPDRTIPVLYGGGGKLAPESLKLGGQSVAEINPLADPMQAGLDTLQKMKQSSSMSAAPVVPAPAASATRTIAPPAHP